MNTQSMFESAELALAAYASLVPGAAPDQADKLQQGGKGMSPKQAAEFARRYPTVVTQYNDIATSFSATVIADEDCTTCWP